MCENYDFPVIFSSIIDHPSEIIFPRVARWRRTSSAGMPCHESLPRGQGSWRSCGVLAILAARGHSVFFLECVVTSIRELSETVA